MKKLLLLSLLALQVEANEAVIRPLPVFGVSTSVTRDAVNISYNSAQFTCAKPSNISVAANQNVKVSFKNEKSGHLLVLGYDTADMPASAIDDITFKNQKFIEVDYKRLEGAPNLYYFAFDQQETQIACGAIVVKQ